MRFMQTWSLRGRPEGTQAYCPAFPAQVPGNAQWDYARAHGMENFAYADNVTAFLNIENYEWLYTAALDYQAGAGERVFFVAEGIDYEFDIYLDGQLLHSQEGMYTPVELDITDKVQIGSELSVFIHTRPWRKDAEQGGRQAADQCCKPPVTYGWDWNPRLITSGIWQEAYIETRKDDHILACEPFYTLNDDLTAAQVRFETQCASDVTYTLQDPDGNVVYSGKDACFTLENVRLWWCNGQGEPALYTWEARTGSDCKQGHIGFRQVRLVRNKGADFVPIFPKSRYPSGITIELNGRRIFAKGSNWVNPDLFFGRITKETYEPLILLAKDANMNILRIWGGAGINKKAFYALCDQHGIMVWQEFMLACNNYKGTPHYLAVLEWEATSIIRQLRKHPCLVFWCGGNELFNSWSGMDEQSHALRLLNKLCYEHDFQRPFLMTSPMFGMGHGGYTFWDDRTNQDVFTQFAGSHNTAYTEFGVPSITNAEDLKTIIPADELFPIQDTPAWRTHHGFGSWRNTGWVCNDILDRYFGQDSSLEERVYHSQWLQSEGYRAIFEESRRQWPYCSMALNWCYNEPWLSAANNNLLSYPAKPKPAYYAVKKALRPVLASARIPKFDWKGGENFTAELWLLNDSPLPVSDTIRISIILDDVEYPMLTWETGEVAANTNKLGPAINFKLPLTAETNQLKLVLHSEKGNGSTYTLLFKNGKKPVYTFALNQ